MRMAASENQQVLREPIQVVIETFQLRGQGRYGTEAVTQLQHALQSATLAIEDGANHHQVAAALLHDFGHIIDDAELPAGLNSNLDDAHERRSYQWLLMHFGPDVAEPSRLHVAAKRYLCTVAPNYAGVLSPTSYKSWQDQGGRMSEEEIEAFRNHPYFHLAVQLRRWDDQAKDPHLETQSIDAFLPYLQACL